MSKKYIIIVSEPEDASTNQVLNWIRFDTCYIPIVIGIHNKICVKNINGDESFTLNVGGVIIYDYEIFSYWFRRSSISLEVGNKKSKINYDFANYLSNFINLENSSISEYLNYTIRNKTISLDSQANSFPNKVIMYSIAKKVRLKAPNFLISGNKPDLLKFCQNNKQVIVKPINTTFYFNSKSIKHYYHTSIINEKDISNKEDKFGISFFQEYIEKKIEIRTYILMGKIFSMAIFSQRDSQTKMDFRNYNYDKSNRTVPFKLPKQIEVNLLQLMKLLKYDSASIDIIYSKSGEFYFLEANPFGQFGMVSHPCNYYIERHIANYLGGKNN